MIGRSSNAPIFLSGRHHGAGVGRGRPLDKVGGRALVEFGGGLMGVGSVRTGTK